VLLHVHLTSSIRFPSRITIVDNGSDDSTRLIGARLARDLDNVRCIHVAEKGRRSCAAHRVAGK